MLKITSIGFGGSSDPWFDSDSEEQDWRFGDGFCDDDLNTMGKKYDGGDCCLPDTVFAHSFCTECQCLEEYSYEDSDGLLECNTDDECPLSLNQCNIMLTPTPSGKIGYCVPLLCETDNDCHEIGDVCSDGSLSGTCNSGHNCEYDPVKAIALCGKKIIF